MLSTLHRYLRLGGVQTAREILAWSDKAEEIQKSLERFCELRILDFECHIR